MKTLVTIGRGGTGKSSFTALMAKCFIESGQSPLLLVDADPDQNLAEMVGIDLKEAGKSTIADLLVSTFIEQGGTTVGFRRRTHETRFGLMVCLRAIVLIFLRSAPSGLKVVIACRTLL
jgi:cellulose biosynthesis protein BcsQ